MAGNPKQVSLVFSRLGMALICVFWLPGRMLRQGIRGGMRATLQDYSDGMAISHWKRNLLPPSSRRGGNYQRMLPSGRRLQIAIRLIGGEPGPAFLEVQVDGEPAALLFAMRPGQSVPSEVFLDGRAGVHYSQAESRLTLALGPEDGRAAHRLVRWVTALLD